MKKLAWFIILIMAISIFVSCSVPEESNINEDNTPESEISDNNKTDTEISENSDNSSTESEFSDNSDNSIDEVSDESSDETSEERVPEESEPQVQDETQFYVFNSVFGKYNIEKHPYDGTINGVLDKLKELEAINAETELLSYSIKENVAHLDLSKAFGKELSGAAFEYANVVSLVNTVLDFSGAEAVSFTLEGKTLMTSQNIYDKPLKRFDEIPKPNSQNNIKRLGIFTYDLVIENDMVLDFVVEQFYYDGSIEAAIGILADKKAVPTGTKVISFTIKEDMGYLDLTKEFRNSINYQDIMDLKTFISISNTVLDCFDIAAFYITVEGEYIDTGFIVYDSTFGRHSPQ